MFIPIVVSSSDVGNIGANITIDDPEPLSCRRRPRLSSPVGIALVVLLLVAMPFAELILVLEDELHLSECWSGEGQKQ